MVNSRWFGLVCSCPESFPPVLPGLTPSLHTCQLLDHITLGFQNYSSTLFIFKISPPSNFWTCLVKASWNRSTPKGLWSWIWHHDAHCAPMIPNQTLALTLWSKLAFIWIQNILTNWETQVQIETKQDYSIKSKMEPSVVVCAFNPSIQGQGSKQEELHEYWARLVY